MSNRYHRLLFSTISSPFEIVKPVAIACYVSNGQLQGLDGQRGGVCDQNILQWWRDNIERILLKKLTEQIDISSEIEQTLREFEQKETLNI